MADIRSLPDVESVWVPPPLSLQDRIQEMPEFLDRCAAKARKPSSYNCIFKPEQQITEDSFINRKKIGKGTFGTVFQAVNRHTNELVAMKQILLTNEKEGVPVILLREINILTKANHQNIVKMEHIVTTPLDTYDVGEGGIYLVFEYMDHDLTGLLDSHWREFTLSQIKSFIQQLLSGLLYCHRMGILHRDIKGSNLLINNAGVLKIADFGLARLKQRKIVTHYTNRVVTLWYRPPELLLGSTTYSASSDLWSVGCVIAEILSGKALFQGENEVEQISKIFNMFGTPAEEGWDSAESLDFYALLRPKEKKIRSFRTAYKGRFVTSDALDLLDHLLVLNPDKRFTAEEALQHSYFQKEPFPAQSKLGFSQPCHELMSKQLRKKRQQRPVEENNSFSPPTKVQKLESREDENPPQVSQPHFSHTPSRFPIETPQHIVPPRVHPSRLAKFAPNIRATNRGKLESRDV